MTEKHEKIPERKLKIKRKKYNAKQFFEFTADLEGRYELINGQIKLMASPNVSHQTIAGELHGELRSYLKGKPCRAFVAPLDVVLFEKDEKNDKNKEDDSQNVFQPDVFVVCDPGKISKNKINGAPDLVIEIVSPSNFADDYIDKLVVYMKHGVREYWIVNPEKKTILAYRNEKDKEMENDAYTFEDKIKVNIFDDFAIDFKELNI
ncbi:MAG: Uma2 family endonuclease [Oscillospiraceae bacterium]|nr:Uma2 family endonuclease [Oscillospiraceae bacterium]